MKKINLKGISEILSEKEMKNVLGGTGGCASLSQCAGNCVTQWGSPAYCTTVNTSGTCKCGSL